jgi:aspartyl-tRNA(Asn)/glutamyl-tRNA(Gln) amidotransferase subunit A
MHPRVRCRESPMPDLLTALGVVEAGARLRDGRLTSETLTQSCLSRIEELGSVLNAFITVTADRALEEARDADREIAAGYDRGPLHGIPISLKDLLDQAGVRTTAGSRVLPDHPAERDAVVTARLRAAGAVLVGKTNLHEFAFGTTSEDSAFGPVRHPLDSSRSPGGSSGGSAVAVATGMSLASIGTDTGGSVRIPSAACGLVGLKPGTGEVPTDGVVPLSQSLDHVGPLTRSVADAAALFYVLARGAPRAPVPRRPDSLRLGRLSGYFEAQLESPVRAAYDAAIDRLAGAGVSVEPVSLPHAEEIPAIYLHIVLPEAAAWHAHTLDTCPDRYTPAVRMRLEMGRYLLAEDYLRAQAGRGVIRREVTTALADVDALVLPGLAIQPPVLGKDTCEIDGQPEPVRSLMLRLTQPFNLSGHPAIVLPCGSTAAGLPASLQLVGQHRGTTSLLDVAAGVETALRA